MTYALLIYRTREAAPLPPEIETPAAIERARQICPDDEHAIEIRPVTWRWTP